MTDNRKIRVLQAKINEMELEHVNQLERNTDLSSKLEALEKSKSELATENKELQVENGNLKAENEKLSNAEKTINLISEEKGEPETTNDILSQKLKRLETKYNIAPEKERNDVIFSKAEQYQEQGGYLWKGAILKACSDCISDYPELKEKGEYHESGQFIFDEQFILKLVEVRDNLNKNTNRKTNKKKKNI